jgi:hypothetical protein
VPHKISAEIEGFVQILDVALVVSSSNVLTESQPVVHLKIIMKIINIIISTIDVVHKEAMCSNLVQTSDRSMGVFP